MLLVQEPHFEKLCSVLLFLMPSITSIISTEEETVIGRLNNLSPALGSK